MLTLCKGYLPLLVAILDYWHIQRRQLLTGSLTDSSGPSHPWALPKILNPSSKCDVRFIPACTLLGIAGSLSSWALHYARSSYICPLSSYGKILVPFCQLLSTICDCYIVSKITVLLSQDSFTRASQRESPALVLGSALLVSKHQRPCLEVQLLIV